jgi:hypothetical protein
MDRLPTPHPCERTHELRFRSLSNEGRGYAFPCDREGHVDLDQLTEHARRNYFFAHTVIGSEFYMPVVLPVRLPVGPVVVSPVCA